MSKFKVRTQAPNTWNALYNKHEYQNNVNFNPVQTT